MTLQEAIEILSMMTPVRSYDGTGDLWFGSNRLADATFKDWGAARAVSIILNAVDERTSCLKMQHCGVMDNAVDE